jgi:2'-5' RNA ligase
MTQIQRKSVYTLAIIPDERITGLVGKLKKRLGEELGRSYGSLHSLAHISLFVFLAGEDDYPVILAEFKRILAGLQSFEVRLAGFGDFSDKPECTFYIKPDPDSDAQIAACCNKVQANFSKFLRRTVTEKWRKLVTGGDSHMSIARELSKPETTLCYQLFTEVFDESFPCNAFVVRRLNEKLGQYDIIDTIPLLGHEYIAGQQMRLF